MPPNLGLNFIIFMHVLVKNEQHAPIWPKSTPSHSENPGSADVTNHYLIFMNFNDFVKKFL